MSSRTFRRMAILVGIVALLVPLAASGGGHGKAGGATGRSDSAKRMLFATDSAGSLLSFRAAAPEAARSRPITGLPSGVVLKGIDFRPATGDLYALGSDKVVYRVNPRTAIAVAEGPAFETAATALTGDRIGFDFNPTVDKIRVTSDADDNLRLDPDPGSLLATDTTLTPAEVTVVGSAYSSDSLPILPKGAYYELWFVGPGDRPGRRNRISAGTFHPDRQSRSHVRFTAAVDHARFPVLSVTAEPGDGDPRPTGSRC
jgi:Domain of unknown function (DUF4394)/Anti-sigma-K factor rskA